MSLRGSEGQPEGDRLAGVAHPRETQAFFGHQEAEATLLAAYRSGRLPQTWIIGGREGIGKATLAWRFARFLLAHPDPAVAAVVHAGDLAVAADHHAARQVASLSHPDLFLLRREWNEKIKKHFTEIRIDDVRRANGLFQHAAAADGYRICILDAADDLNRNAANALLKLIEEPPARSLFLLIAHRPGRVLPTIRSRSRLLLLQPLPPADVARALQALDPSAGDAALVEAAAGAAGGSVRDAVRILGRSASKDAERLDTMLARLPAVDWHEVHKLADQVAQRDAADEYEHVLARLFDWLDEAVREQAGAGARRLAPYAEVWEKLGAATREAEALNLDKRPLILSIFADLAAARRASQA